MNDRFKFRIWDKECNYFHDMPDYFVGMDASLNVLQRNHRNEWDILPLENQENYVIQQCTGLKDKNGEFIFEGDLLHSERNDELFDPAVFVIDWSEGIMWVDDIDPEVLGSCPFTLHENYDYEIIGNIFENPELLKK